MKTTRVFAETSQAYIDGFDVIANMGGSRSSKTFSELQLFHLIMSRSKKKRIITVVSHSLPHLEGGAIRDFDNILETEGLSPDLVRTKRPYVYKINRSLLEFVGFDNPGKALGAARDILLINEANKMPFNVCHQLMQRTTECSFFDWNPSEEFWFDTEYFAKRPRCKVIKSNFLDNYENLSDKQLREFKIGFEKAMDEDARGKRGYWWNWWQVYGLGNKGQLEGVIFQNWTTYKELPDGKLYKMFVVDWGGTHPTSLVELNIDKDNMKLYIKQHVYIPQILNSKFIETIWKVNPDKHEVICDAARSDKIYELQNAGINAYGSSNQDKLIISGIEKLQEYEIFIEENSQDAINEFSRHKWAVDKITGKPTGKPEDANNHCFVGSTLIKTNKGLKKILDIKVNDVVLTSNGFCNVIKTFHNGKKQVYKYTIQFDIFSLSLTCTKNHFIKTDTGWIKISELQSGMRVYLNRCLMEKNISCTQKKDTFQEGLKECILRCGNSIMVKYLKVTMFIIKMEILGITLLKILKLKKDQFINGTMEKKGFKKILNGLKNSIQKGLKKLRNGMLQKKVSSNTESKQLNKVLEFLHMEIENARFAVKSLQQKNICKNFVPIGVNLSTEEIQELTTRIEYVQNVEKNLSSINILKQEIVAVHVQNQGIENVYDLMVKDNHEYFANGVLVHNCIDPVRYGIRFFHRVVSY